MILSVILAFLPSILIGCLLVLIVWPGAYRRDIWLKIALGTGIGQGITSCLYFAFSLFFRPRNRVYWAIEAGVFLILLVAAIVIVQRRGQPLSKSSSIPPPISWITLLLLTTAGITLTAAAASFTIQSLMQPHGIQDAWNIWNMRARFLFRGAAGWKDLFSPAIYWLNHPDYPFLVTAGTARAWNVINSESTLAPILQAAIYALALGGTLFSGLGLRKSWGQAALALTLLAGSSWFVLFGAWQIADIPLDFFILSSLFFLVTILASPTPAHPGYLFLFGLTSGLAAWTKNEGILYLVAVLVAWFLGRVRFRPGFKKILGEIYPVLAGLILPLAVLIYLKLFLAPPSDLFAGQSEGTILSRVMDLSRYGLTISYLWNSFIAFSDWGFPIFLGLLFYAVLFRPIVRPKQAAGLAFAITALLLLALGYFAIYIITPHDLVWHLRTSTNRLVFHFYPPLLLILFWAVRTPEEIVSGIMAGSSL